MKCIFKLPDLTRPGELPCPSGEMHVFDFDVVL